MNKFIMSFGIVLLSLSAVAHADTPEKVGWLQKFKNLFKSSCEKRHQEKIDKIKNEIARVEVENKKLEEEIKDLKGDKGGK